jgi:hypothetical protein
MPKNNIDQREKDIQSICEGVLIIGIRSTGDYGPGGECPFCFSPCSWNAAMDEVIHEQNCIYLIAKDLSTGMK